MIRIKTDTGPGVNTPKKCEYFKVRKVVSA